LFDFETDIPFLNMPAKRMELNYKSEWIIYVKRVLYRDLNSYHDLSADGDLRSFALKIKILKGNPSGKIRSSRCAANR